MIFIVTNEKRHDEINQTEYVLCSKAQTIADNQRRVIVALIELEESEKEHSRNHMGNLKAALKLVPDFNCQQFKEGG